VILIKDVLERPPSARRFVTLRASGNNVMQKLEIYGSLALVGFRLLGGLVGWKEVLELLEMGCFQTLQPFQKIQ